MRLVRLSHVLLSLTLVFAGCAPDLPVANPPSVVVAEFDPFADPPRLPAPNDRLRDRRTGLLVVADEPTSGSDPSMARPPSPALLEYNQYLRTLDGYPAETPVRASFSAALDPRTVAPATLVKEGSVAVVDLREERVLSPVEYELQLADGGKTLRVLPRLADTQGRPSTKPWRLGHGYLVIVIGGADPAGLRTSDGKPVLASRATWFTRSRSPLLSLCAEGSPDRSTDRCLCPGADDALDPACSPATGLTLDEAQRLEPERRRIAGLLTRWVPLVGMGRARDNVVLAWTFTIAHGPFAVFDPRGLPGGVRVPFPNDTLLDANGHVMLAPPDGAPDALKALYASLGGLDGFSTTGDALVEVEVADDAPGPPLGVVAGKSARLVNLTTPSAAPTIDAAAEVIHGGLDYAGRIAIRPRRALLPDGVHYAAALTSAITDSRRRPLRPSPATRLLLMNAPLFADGRSTLPALLADADAQALEAVRLSYAGQGLWDATANPLGTRREEVAVLWTFRTLSVTKALVDVAALPSQRSLPTDVTIASVEPADSRWGAHLDRAVIGAMHSRLALSPSGALDLAGGRDVDVPFLLLTPKRVAATEMNVVIVQHGFGGWRGDVRAIADAFAALGYATVGIDTYLHGARARCSVDSDCRGGSCGAGGLCSTSLQVKCDDDRQCAAGGTCDGRSGQCSTGLAAESSLCLGWHDARGVAVSECKPTVSGAGFLNLGNPLATAGSLRQQVLDLVQLTRVLRSDDAAGLRAQLARSGVLLDGGRVAYFGQSLGAVEGALFLSVAAEPVVGVLNAGGGRLADLYARSSTTSAAVASFLGRLGAPLDSVAGHDTLNLYRWALDAADPVNFARAVVAQPLGTNMPKRVIVQEAGRDGVVANDLTDGLAAELGVPLTADGKPAQLGASGVVSTYFPDATDGFALRFTPEASTAPAQRQAATWIGSLGTDLSSP